MLKGSSRCRQCLLPGASAFSEIRISGQPPLALRDAVRANRIPASDLPEIIANIRCSAELRNELAGGAAYRNLWSAHGG